MKKHLIPALVLALSATALAAADKPDLTDSKKRVSYAIGLDIGSSFKQGQIEVDPALLAAGIADALAGNPALSEAEMRQTLQAFQQEMQAKAMARQQEEGSNNLKTGETFLAANGKKEGVKTTASGLQYKSLKAGAGKSPKATGTVIDGTVFDSSVKRGEPVEFSVDGVIPGWTEALQLMKVGDKWQLFIPSKLAYGERGTPGGPIGPNSTLIFEVELLAIAN
jgi:FKBP-type peptidyl-prolyl cis-trans isomerase FklB